MQAEKLKSFVYIILAILGGGLIAFLFFKYVFLLILPFLIAWGIAFATRPLATTLRKRIRLPERALRVILAMLIAIGSLGILLLAIWGLAAELWNFLSGIGEGDALRELIDGITSGALFDGLLDGLGNAVREVLYNLAVSFATTLGSAVTSWVGAIPRVLLFLLVTVISTAYFSLELENINRTVEGLTPRSVYTWLSRFRRGFFSAGIKYVRSYLLLMLITFAVMLIGMIALGRPYALLVAFVIAVVDLLPVIGAGTVLVPWSVYELTLGDTHIGIGLLVLFGAHTVIRQLAEPKIVGKNLGVHPIITLALIYVGYSLLGFIGILFVPVATVLIDITLGKDDAAKVDESATTE